MRLRIWNTAVTILTLSFAVKAFDNMFIADSNIDCTLASPPLIYDTSSIKVNITGQFCNNERDPISIGYYRVYQMFEYIGCVKLSDLNGQYVQKEIPGDELGFCFSACGRGTLFGIYSTSVLTTSCYCLEENITETTNIYYQCNIACTRSGLACGGNNGSLASVYKFRNFSFSVQSQIVSLNVCYTYTPSNGFDWSPCTDTNYNLACMCNGIKENSTYECCWINASMKCSTIYGLGLVSYQNAIKGPDHGKMWLANLRSATILFEDHPNQQLSMIGINGTCFLNTTLSNYLSRKLCVNDTSLIPYTSRTSLIPNTTEMLLIPNTTEMPLIPNASSICVGEPCAIINQGQGISKTSTGNNSTLLCVIVKSLRGLNLKLSNKLYEN